MSKKERLQDFNETLSNEKNDFKVFEELDNFTLQIKEERFLKEEANETDIFKENFTKKLETLNADWGNEIYTEEKDKAKTNALFLGLTIALADIFEDSKQNNTTVDFSNISIDQILNHPAINKNNFKNINLTLNNLKDILNISPQKEGTVQSVVIKRWEASKKALPIIFEEIYSKAKEENDLGESKAKTDYGNVIGGSFGGVATFLAAQKTNLPVALLAGGSAYFLGKTANDYLNNDNKSFSDAAKNSGNEIFNNISSLFKKGVDYFTSSNNSRTEKWSMAALGIGTAAITLWKGGDALKSMGGMFSSSKKEKDNPKKEDDSKGSSAFTWGAIGLTTAAGLLAAYNLIPKIPDVKGAVDKTKQKAKKTYKDAKEKVKESYKDANNNLLGTSKTSDETQTNTESKQNQNTNTTNTDTDTDTDNKNTDTNINTTSDSQESIESKEVNKEKTFYDKIAKHISLKLSNDAVDGSGLFEKSKEEVEAMINLEWITDENSEFRKWVKETLNTSKTIGMYTIGVLFAIFVVKKLLKSKFTNNLGSAVIIRQIFAKGLQSSVLKFGILSSLLGGLLYSGTARGELFENMTPEEEVKVRAALKTAKENMSPKMKLLLGFTKDNIRIPEEEKETYKNNFVTLKNYVSNKNFTEKEQKLIKKETIATCELLSAYQEKHSSFPKYLITSLYKNLDILGIKQKVVENNNLYLYRINTDPAIEFKNLPINPDSITHETNEAFKDFEKQGLKAGYNRLLLISRHVENEYIEKHNGEKLKLKPPKTNHQKEWQKWLVFLSEFENLQKNYPKTKIPKNFWERKEWKILEKFSYSTKIVNNNGIIQLTSGESMKLSSKINICVAPNTDKSEINPFLINPYPDTMENLILDPHRKGWRAGAEKALEKKIASLDKYPEAQIALKELQTKLSQTQNISDQNIILFEAFKIIDKYTDKGVQEAVVLATWPILYGSFEALIKSPAIAQYDAMMTIVGQNGEEFSLTEYLTKTYLGPMPYAVIYGLLKQFTRMRNGFFTDTRQFLRFANIINPVRIIAKGATAGVGRVFGAPGMIEQIKFQYNSVKGLHFIPPELRHIITSGSPYKNLFAQALHYEIYKRKFAGAKGKGGWIAKQFAGYSEVDARLKRIYKTVNNIYFSGGRLSSDLMEKKIIQILDEMKTTNTSYEKLPLKYKPFKEIEKLKLEAIAKYNSGIFNKDQVITELDNISKHANAHKDFHTFSPEKGDRFIFEEKMYDDFDNTLKNERDLIKNNQYPKVNISELKKLPKDIRQKIVNNGRWRGHEFKINHATEFAKNVFASGTKALGKTLEVAGKLVPYAAGGFIGFDAYVNWVKYYEDLENANLGLASVHKGMSTYRAIETGVILSGTGAGQRALVSIPKIGSKVASGASRLVSLSMAPIFIAGEILYSNASSSLEKEHMKEKDYIKAFSLEDLEVGKNKLLHLLSLSLNENTVGDNLTNWFKEVGITKKADKRKEMWKAYGFLESQKFSLTVSERRFFVEEFFHFIEKLNSSIPPYKFLQNIKIVERASLWAKKRIETVRNKGLFESEMKIDENISFETINENIDKYKKDLEIPKSFDIFYKSISQLYIKLGGKGPLTKENLKNFFREENSEHFGLYWNKKDSKWYIYLRSKIDFSITGFTPKEKYDRMMYMFYGFKSSIFYQNEDSILVDGIGSPYGKRLEERAEEFKKILKVKE